MEEKRSSTQLEEDDTPDYALIQAQNPLSITRHQAEDQPATKNEFTARKTAAHAMMDAALLMANISQLRMLLAANSDTVKFFTPVLTLVVCSISFQLLFAIFILVIWARENHWRHSRHPERRLAPNPTLTSSAAAACPHNNNNNNTVGGNDDARSTSAARYSGICQTRRAPLLPNLVGGLTTVSIDFTDDDDDGDDCDVVDGVPVRGESGEKKYDDPVTRWIHFVTLLLVFMITVTNMFITGLGLETKQEHSAPVDTA